MKRRNFIRNVALGGAALAIPTKLLGNVTDQVTDQVYDPVTIIKGENGEWSVAYTDAEQQLLDEMGKEMGRDFNRELICQIEGHERLPHPETFEPVCWTCEKQKMVLEMAENGAVSEKFVRNELGL